MLTRQQIIKTIRQMHRRGEALNISAVKRSHPELIQTVYAVKPFWGWKQAIKDAGIDYADITVEVQEDIICEVCRKPMRFLAVHLKRKHGVDSDEYLMDYPDSDLMCEAMRAEKTIRQNKHLHHWEPAWSREYILDRVAEFHRQGFFMNYSDIQELDPQLVGVVEQYFNKNAWSNVLTEIGLDPVKLEREIRRRIRRYPDKEAVIQAIKQRVKKGLRVITYSLQYGRWRDAMLLNRGIEYFGSWAKALKAAGIDPEEYYRQLNLRRRKYPDAKAVLEGIKRRIKERRILNNSTLLYGPDRDFPLLLGARRSFGSWNKALKTAGLDPAKVQHDARARAAHERHRRKMKLWKSLGRRGRYLSLLYINRGQTPSASLVRLRSPRVRTG